MARAGFADFAQAPCWKFNKFGLFLEDQKISTGFYNGGLRKIIFGNKINNQYNYFKNNTGYLYYSLGRAKLR